MTTTMPEALMADGGWVGRSTVDAFTEFAAVSTRGSPRRAGFPRPGPP